MLMTIEPITAHTPLNDFVDNLAESHLTCYASDLIRCEGCRNFEELSQAVKRATEVCNCMHMPLQENFKVVYRSQNGEVVQDWKLSPVAYMLTMLNADARSNVVARLQVEMVKRMMNA
ncbi:hypothetical protein [Pontibacter ruber]|uniref:Roadblock/LC7 domain-containing protein n=1 Tax=Pontibacter ruber TaxID=1343895 RepID=A0ABW5CS77_9BACT|nr:hypothetical protein [Pontibacter ruber]